MSVYEHPDFDNHENILFATDEASGLKAILAVHSSARGPAVGGCRMWTYANSADALTDVLRLSQGMSFKNVMADLPIGGGKSVIMKPDGEFDRKALFEAFGRALNALNGEYMSAEDVGTSPADIQHASRITRHVVGLPSGTGDPSPVTAKGVYLGIEASVERALGKNALAGVKVAVQGATGHVGAYLVRRLAQAGADLFLADIREEELKTLADEVGAVIVEDPDAIYDVEADVFTPCALGAIINPSTIDRLKVKVVAGAANNQLQTREMGAELQKRGILYAPDYVINAGGIINVMGDIDPKFDSAWVEGKLVTLKATLGEIFDLADKEGRPANIIADEIARRRLKRAADAKAEAVAA